MQGVKSNIIESVNQVQPYSKMVVHQYHDFEKLEQYSHKNQTHEGTAIFKKAQELSVKNRPTCPPFVI